MSNLLSQWLEAARPKLEELDYAVKYHDDGLPNRAVGVDLDSHKFVGTISHWPPKLFEFQFNDCVSGDVVVLETMEFDNLEDLDAYIDKLTKDRLARLSSG